MRRIADATLKEVKDRLGIYEVVSSYIQLSRDGREWKACCPFHNESSASFCVVPNKQFYHCFGCGAHGDALGFIMQYEKLSFSDAVVRGASMIGIDLNRDLQQQKLPPIVQRQTEAQSREEDKAKTRLAENIWKGCVPAAGTAVENYLRGRGITLPVPDVIRYHATLGCSHNVKQPDGSEWVKETTWQAMVAQIQNSEGKLIGVHRTYLAAGGAGKAPKYEIGTANSPGAAKKMQGNAWCGAIRLAPAAETLMVGEGIETCLSAMMAMDGIGAWAAMSLSNIAGAGIDRGPLRESGPRAGTYLPNIEPDMKRPGIILPDEVKRVIILADNDNKDPEAAECIYQRAMTRWLREGRSVKIVRPPLGMDFNDWLVQLTSTTQQVAA